MIRLDNRTDNANRIMDNFGWNLVVDNWTGLISTKLLIRGQNYGIEGLGQEVMAYVVNSELQRTGATIQCRIISSIVHEELDALGLANMLAFRPEDTVIYFHDSRGEVTRVGYIEGYSGRLRARGTIETVRYNDGTCKVFLNLDDPMLGSLELSEPLSSSSRLAKMYMGEVWVCYVASAIRNSEGAIVMYSMQQQQPEKAVAEFGKPSSTIAVKWLRKSRFPTQHEHIPNHGSLSSQQHQIGSLAHPAAAEPLREIETYAYIRRFPSAQTQGLLAPLDVIETSFLYGIVMPYFRGGDLFEYVKSYPGNWNEELAKDLFRRILVGVQSMRRLGICHRDLSAENVMLDIDDNKQVIDCVIGDFGQAVTISNSGRVGIHDGQSSPLTPPGTISNVDEFMKRGSHYSTPVSPLASSAAMLLFPNERTYKKLYRPPELADAELAAKYQMVDYFKSDVYALGIILYLLVTRNQPFDAEYWSEQLDWYATLSDHQLAYNDVRVQALDVHTGSFRTKRCELHEVISPACLDLLNKMLAYDPDDRSITVDEMLSHPWLTQQTNVLFENSDRAKVASA